MAFDWKKTLPFIAAAATGGVPALVAAAASAVSDAIGVKVDPTPSAIDAALSAATPEQLAALRKIDADLKVRMRELDTEDRKTAANTEIAYVADVGDARKNHAQNGGVLALGFLINLASYLCVFAVLYGCFWVLGNSGKITVDPGVSAMIGGVIGAAVQWLMSNAAQANSFFFGSSPSSRAVSAELARAVGDAASKVR